jgi:hypothetical protein
MVELDTRWNCQAIEEVQDSVKIRLVMLAKL